MPRTIIAFLTMAALAISLSLFVVQSKDGNLTHVLSALKIKGYSNAYATSVHYFSNAAPFTFWQEFEEGNLRSDFAAIKADGFNSIILVVPFSGFSSSGTKLGNSISETLFTRFEKVLSEAHRARLSVYLRLGYAHNSVNLETSDGLCRGIFTDTKFTQKWQTYLERISGALSKYKEGFAGAFVSWEDFWCGYGHFRYLGESDRMLLAEQMGYAEWLNSKDSELNPVTVPAAEASASNAIEYFTFMEHNYKTKVIKPLKEHFKEASVEVRVDVDCFNGGFGRNSCFEHDLFHNEFNFRAAYWAPYWNAKNDQILPSSKSLKILTRLLNKLTHGGNNPNILIGQFNFSDNTPGFARHAKLDEDDLSIFFSGAALVLKKYTIGYGLWAYRDYADNVLHNASFELGLMGWEYDDKVSINTKSGDSQVIIEDGGIVSQSFQAAARIKPTLETATFELCIAAQSPARLTLNIANKPKVDLDLFTGDNCITIPSISYYDGLVNFKLTANTEAHIDEIKLYGFVQKLGVYDEFGQPGKNHLHIREFNKKLSAK